MSDLYTNNPGDGTPFEKIKHTASNGMDYWLSRDLATTLGYADYRNFEQVLAKAKQACLKSGQRIEDHFGDVTKMVDIGSGAQREQSSTKMSRYACYLAIQNADPSKEAVALGQTYFASQTRRQELNDNQLEAERRLLLRDEMRAHNVKLADAAKVAGVVQPLDYAIFQNHGYKGLYGGLEAKAIKARKGLGEKHKLLDHMNSTELAANLFRATQTEEKLKREQIKGKDAANQTHFEVGKKVRKTIEDLGGTMPEELPAAENINQIAAAPKKELPRKGG